ncbi:MAG: TonB-dependent receptor [Massilibacteroides sp.]|nr:TonB-dependent receptor [Massilibacteroides sp.]MDD4114337.1 TonB-dependent receptor [Massilibacteroides sp.]
MKKGQYALLFSINVTKGLRIMKLIFLFLIINLSVCFAESTYAQATTFSLNMNNKTIKEVFKEIESSSKFSFFYYDEVLDANRKIDLHVTKQTIDKILDQLFQGTDNSYSIEDYQVFISQKGKESIDNTQTIQQVQKKRITGIVRDENGDPIIGANIIEKGTTNGITTDLNGHFSLLINPKASLIVSYIGYNRQEIAAGTRSELTITLKEDAQGLDEIVVIGYGTQRKLVATGSISTLKGETIKQSPAANISNNVVGRITGVIANNRSGEPGSDWSDIFIRGKGTMGDNRPLYVIDGVANRGNFERLNPMDIESITVLKDASAAIYGAQAANGVILITTKRGESGKPTITYDGNFGLSEPTRLPNLMNAYQYMIYKDEANKYDGLPEYFGEIKEKYLTGDIDGITLADTDWMSTIFRNFAPQTQHSLSISGGNDRVKYFVSGGYLYQEPLFKSTVGNNYNTVQVRSNIDVAIVKDFTVSVELAARREDRDMSNYSSEKIFTETLNVYPYVPAFYPNGLPTGGISRGLNPAILTTGITGYYKNIDKFLNSKINFELNMPWITKGLSFSGYIAYDTQNGKDKTFNDQWDAYQYTKDAETGEFSYNNIREETNEEGSITLDQSAYDNETTTVNTKLAYQNKFGPHSVDAFVAFEQSQYKSEAISASRRDFLSGQIQLLPAGADERKGNSGSASHSARQNYFSRLDYGYMDKYLATLTLRIDGSSNFPPNGRWGTFPAASIGWRISEEGFIKNNLDFINNLKIRASWGKMGNDRIAPYQYLATYTLTEGAMIGNPPTRLKGFYEGVTPNTNITWERIYSKNIGLEGSLWDSHLSFDFNFFHAKRKGILITRNASVPSFAAINLPDQNLGIVVNRGLEIELNHRNRVGDVDYYVGGNITFARNKVVYMDEAIDVPAWQKKTGYALDSWLIYKTDGLYQTQEEVDNTPHLHNAQPGDIKYLDVDGDGEITSRDQVRIHKGSTPELVFGLPMGVSWKGISLNMLWQGQALAKQLILPQTLNIDVAYYNGRWKSAEETPNAKYPRAYNYEDPVNDRASEFWLKDASFIRLKSLELAYDFKPGFLKKMQLSNLRIYINGSNLLCFDAIKLMDPESVSPGGYYYPQTRVYNVGVNVSF